MIAAGDNITGVFLVADEYGPDEEPRHVSFREYRGGPLHIWRLNGPLYGSKDSPYRWWDSFVKHITRVEKLVDLGFEPEKSTIEGVIEDAASNFKRGEDEPYVFYNPKTGMRLVLYVDDAITRRSEHETKRFYGALNMKYPLWSWSILTPAGRRSFY